MTGTDLVPLGRAGHDRPPVLVPGVPAEASDEPSSGPPDGTAGRFGARLRAAWTPVDTAAAVLTAVHLVAVLILVAPGSYYLDDLRAQGYAQGQPFWSFVVGSNGTHFAPLPRTLDWLQATRLPLQHEPAVLVTLLVRLLLAVAFWRLLRRLFGARPVTLVPFTVLLATPVLLVPTAWYRQSITILACTVAMVWALDAHLRFQLHRRRGDLVAVGVATAAAVCFLEKGALLPGILLAASVLLFGRGRRLAGWWAAVRAGLPPVLLSGLLVGAFLLVYRSGPFDRPELAAATPAQLVELAARTVGALAPGLLGIGWQLEFPSPYVGIPFPGDGWRALTALVVVALFLPAVRRHPGRVVRGLLLGAAWLAGSVVLVAAGRFAPLGMLLADSPRVWADLVPALLLAAALALLPWRFGAAAAPAVVTVVVEDEHPADDGADDGADDADDGAPGGVPGPAPGPVAAGLDVLRSLRPSRRLAVPALVTVGTLLMVTGSAVSWSRFAGPWWDNPTGRWVDAARAGLAQADPRPRVLPRPLPEAVMPSWVQATFPSDRPLVALLRPDARFGDGDGRLVALTDSGRLRPVLPVPVAVTGTGRGCVATVRGQGEVPVRLPAPVLHRRGAVVEVALLVDRPTRPVVRLVRTDGSQRLAEPWNTAPLTAGPHTVLLPFPAGEIITGVRVATPGAANTCVAGLRVWVPAG